MQPEPKSKPSRKAIDPRGKAMLDEQGHEVVSNVPEAPPLGWKRQPTMVDHIREMVRSERLRQEAEAAGAETFEEAEDFDVGDDLDLSSPYEAEYEPLSAVKARKEVADKEAEVVAKAKAKEAADAKKKPKSTAVIDEDGVDDPEKV